MQWDTQALTAINELWYEYKWLNMIWMALIIVPVLVGQTVWNAGKLESIKSHPWDFSDTLVGTWRNVDDSLAESLR